MHAAIRFR